MSGASRCFRACAPNAPAATEMKALIAPTAIQNSVTRTGLLLLIAGVDRDGNSLSDSNAHRGEPALDVAPLHFVDERGEDARSTRSERMAQGNCAAVDVHGRWVEIEILNARQGLGRERLVQLHQSQLFAGPAGDLQRVARGGHRTDAHVSRFHSFRRSADKARQ